MRYLKSPTSFQSCGIEQATHTVTPLMALVLSFLYYVSPWFASSWLRKEHPFPVLTGRWWKYWPYFPLEMWSRVLGAQQVLQKYLARKVTRMKLYLGRFWGSTYKIKFPYQIYYGYPRGYFHCFYLFLLNSTQIPRKA